MTRCLLPCSAFFSIYVLAACGSSSSGAAPDATPTANAVPVFTSDSSIDVPEGSTATGYKAAASDADGDTLSFILSGGADQALFTIDAASGELEFKTEADFEQPSDADSDNVYELEIAANDGTDSASLPVLVSVTDVSEYTIVYSNDFETDTNGFNTTEVGELVSNEAGGTSTWLGGDRSIHGSTTQLTLSGLTEGTVYDLAFEVYLGGSWDGSGSFGPDFFSVTSSSSGILVNATFVNDFPLGGGSGKTQTYSDATPLGDGGEFNGREGADVVLGEPIYYFGTGAGNPLLSFTATGATETLIFAAIDAQVTVDEIIALDNVVVSTGP